MSIENSSKPELSETGLAGIIAFSKRPEEDIKTFMETAMSAKIEGSATEQSKAILEASELERFIARDQFESAISGLARRLEDGDDKSALEYLVRLGLNIVENH
ncbi:MAG: hypothetical protein AAB367_01410 [Patescibacteria group bacterium]